MKTQTSIINNRFNHFNWFLKKYPNGLLGVENSIPVIIDGYELELNVFKPELFRGLKSLNT
jgi:hypothetical protein